MDVLVTGGSGFVGSEIVEKLRQTGHRVRILARGKRAFSSPNFIRGDILDSSSLDSALESISAVIHCVGIISEFRQNTFQRIHIDGTANLMKAASAAGVRKFIYISALGTRHNARSRYHQSKWAAEEIVR